VFEYHYIARPLKPTLWYKNLTPISYTSPVIAHFVQIANFSLPWQQSRSGANLMNDTVKFVDLENPQLVQESGIYLLYRPTYSQFYVQSYTQICVMVIFY